MNKERGVTLITVVIMIVVISIIATASIVASRTIFDESKESVLKKNRTLVESAVSRYSAKASTSGLFTPANQEFPGEKNPSFEFVSGDGSIAQKGVGEDWYLLLEKHLESIGISYVKENYLVNYKLNVVIPLSEAGDVFELVEYYKK